jgi:thioredoxin 1
MTIYHTTDATFEADVLKSTVPVLLDFWAPWCGPCVALGPVLDQIAADLEGRLKIVKMNVDEPSNAITPSQYGVRGIPMLLLIKDGKVISNKVGSAPKSDLLAWIENALK